MIVKNNIKIENARIIFRNFSGTEGKFNPAGRRNFCVLLDDDVAKALIQDGWNIRWLEPRDEYTDRQAYMQVAVRFESEPSKQRNNPRILLISRKGKSIIDESTVNILDWAEIEKVDLTIRPYNWEVSGKSGVKAYLKSIAVTIVEDEIDEMYFNIPDSTAQSIGGCGQCEACDGSCKHD